MNRHIIGASDRMAAAGAPDTTISLARANLLGIPFFLVIMGLLVGPFILVNGFGRFVTGIASYAGLGVVIPAIITGTLIHEFLHGLGWVVSSGKSFGSVKFGFHWKTITPFAHFTEPIPARAYRIGVVLPGIFVGVFPAIAGYLAAQPALILFGGIFTGAAAGDMLSLWATRKIPGAAHVTDHPTRVGCVIWQPDLPSGDG